MVHKNKNNYISKNTQLISHIGLVVMLAATVVHMAESVEHESRRVIGALQPHYSYALQTADPAGGAGHEGEQTSRGAKEEVPHSSFNVSSARRSPSVSGTIE